ncbi:hypothetical protein WDV93_10635 [Pantoea ananatis]
MGKRSDSRSAALVSACINLQGERHWGVSIDNDTSRAALQALLNAASHFLPSRRKIVRWRYTQQTAKHGA